MGAIKPAADYVRIFDTTLRDGEQSPGATMTSSEKLEVAHMLARLGVDVIEAGFPAASPDDLDAVRAIAETVGRNPATGRTEAPIVCALARAVEADLEKAWTAVRGAARPRIHTFLATSPIHREHKLRMSKDQVLDRIRAMVAVARSLSEDVEFSPEDAGRTEPEFLWQAIAAAVAAGATTINVPDTVGYTTPDEFGALIAGIIAHVDGIEDVVLSVHCHDDLGMATANTLAGIKNGARQAEVTINGIGERAGNTALEEVVMALATRHASFGMTTGVDTTQIARASRLVSTITGIPVQPNKAIVGANAFAHESGIHQDGMLKHELTYEILRPEAVGIPKTQLVLGKHSGRHAFRERLTELGFSLDENDIDRVFAELKKVAERKKVFTDADLVALVSGRMQSPIERYALDGLQIGCGTIAMPTATVRLRGPDGNVITRAAVGSGPVDACFKAIDEVVAAPAVLLEYAVRAVTEGIDALGEVTVRVRAAETTSVRENPQRAGSPHVFYGHGADTDILVASAKAYLAALNRLLAATQTLGTATLGTATASDATAPSPASPSAASSTASSPNPEPTQRTTA